MAITLKRSRFLLCLWFLIFGLGANKTQAQELYPLAEPASNIPKNVLGVRMFSETFKEINQWRNVSALRLMYGATPNLSVYLTAFASNHHGRKLPEGFPFHNSPERGEYYPFRFNGGNIYAKYRFLTYDKQNEHFRMAAYGEAAYVNETHHESEPNVGMGDNAGFSGGLITTYLYQKFAVSLTLGATLPMGYAGYAEDEIRDLPEIPVYVKYGKSLDYKLSMGYLVYPKKYRSFKETNINIYLELLGKKYGAAHARVFNGMPNEYWLNNYQYPVGLQKGYYLDVAPGLQAIFNSNLRVDVSMMFPFLGKSYVRLYPVYTVGVQYYFFL